MVALIYPDKKDITYQNLSQVNECIRKGVSGEEYIKFELVKK